MRKITRIQRVPGAAHQVDGRLVWLLEALGETDDVEIVDPRAISLSDEDVERLARERFDFDRDDQTAAEALYAPTELAGEAWRPVAGFPRYQVSSLGRVRSLDSVVKHRASGTMRVRGRVLKPMTGGSASDAAFPYVDLYRDGLAARTYIARLVLQTFVGDPPPRGIATARNADPSDVRLSNLRWGTRSERAKRARKPASAAQNGLRRGSAGGVSWRLGGE